MPFCIDGVVVCGVNEASKANGSKMDGQSTNFNCAHSKSNKIRYGPPQFFFQSEKRNLKLKSLPVKTNDHIGKAWHSNQQHIAAASNEFWRLVLVMHVCVLYVLPKSVNAITKTKNFRFLSTTDALSLCLCIEMAGTF